MAWSRVSVLRMRIVMMCETLTDSQYVRLICEWGLLVVIYAVSWSTICCISIILGICALSWGKRDRLPHWVLDWGMLRWICRDNWILLTRGAAVTFTLCWAVVYRCENWSHLRLRHRLSLLSVVVMFKLLLGRRTITLKMHRNTQSSSCHLLSRI